MKEDLCFCELAALHALDSLDSSEQSKFDEHLVEYPELEAEVTMYQEAVNALPYNAAPVPMAVDLKERLFQRLGVEIAPGTPVLAVTNSQAEPDPFPSSVQPSPPFHLTVRGNELVWQPYRVPGVTVAVLHTDLTTRQVSALLRAEPGICYPQHRHATLEEIYMLEGDLIVNGEIYGAGDYIRSESGSIHAPSTQGGCMFFVRTSLDDEYKDSVLTHPS